MRKLLLITITTFINLTLSAQQLYKCNDENAYWTFSKPDLLYSVKLSGFVKETERKSMVSVGDYALQNVIVNKAEYVVDGDDSDISVLVHYALGEGEYLSGTFKQKIDVRFEKPLLPSGQNALFWSFDLPGEYNDEVKSQLFVNVVVGDKIVGFSSSQFTGQKFDDVKAFLLRVVSTLKSAKDQKQLDGLCAGN